MSERTELPMREERCETCRWWHSSGESAGTLGWCHRYPPIFIDHESDAAYPETDIFDWCGEWAKTPAQHPNTPTIS